EQAADKETDPVLQRAMREHNQHRKARLEEVERKQQERSTTLHSQIKAKVQEAERKENSSEVPPETAKEGIQVVQAPVEAEYKELKTQKAPGVVQPEAVGERPSFERELARLKGEITSTNQKLWKARKETRKRALRLKIKALERRADEVRAEAFKSSSEQRESRRRDILRNLSGSESNPSRTRSRVAAPGREGGSKKEVSDRRVRKARDRRVVEEGSSFERELERLKHEYGKCNQRLWNEGNSLSVEVRAELNARVEQLETRMDVVEKIVEMQSAAGNLQAYQQRLQNMSQDPLNAKLKSLIDAELRRVKLEIGENLQNAENLNLNRTAVQEGVERIKKIKKGHAFFERLKVLFSLKAPTRFQQKAGMFLLLFSQGAPALRSVAEIARTPSAGGRAEIVLDAVPRVRLEIPTGRVRLPASEASLETRTEPTTKSAGRTSTAEARSVKETTSPQRKLPSAPKRPSSKSEPSERRASETEAKRIQDQKESGSEQRGSSRSGASKDAAQTQSSSESKKAKQNAQASDNGLTSKIDISKIKTGTESVQILDSETEKQAPTENSAKTTEEKLTAAAARFVDIQENKKVSDEGGDEASDEDADYDLDEDVDVDEDLDIDLQLRADEERINNQQEARQEEGREKEKDQKKRRRNQRTYYYRGGAATRATLRTDSNEQKQERQELLEEQLEKERLMKRCGLAAKVVRLRGRKITQISSRKKKDQDGNEVGVALEAEERDEDDSFTSKEA
ncbi:hypothetical protein OAO01_01005, partial [Oligoflexia bacterium]|nr:hypothetical protein [Oligoflexia bacterium]